MFKLMGKKIIKFYAKFFFLTGPMKKHVHLYLLPCITDELSFKKNLCRYLGMNALIDAYARAEKHKKQLHLY